MPQSSPKMKTEDHNKKEKVRVWLEENRREVLSEQPTWSR